MIKYALWNYKEEDISIMADLKSNAINLAEHLYDEKILHKNEFDNLENQTFDAIILQLKRELQETYPDTKLKRVMKSVHYSNGFTDEKLKENAFLLDEIEQYLVINKFLSHDAAVAYFNNKITSKNFVITPPALVRVMTESLLFSKGKNQIH